MDYLIFGVGFGSTLVLIGWLLRQFGPAFRYRNEPDDVLSAEQILERNDWQRFCIAMGALLSVCGAVILLVTLITLLVRPSDRVGTIIVGTLFVLSLLAVAAWVVMYVNQHRALAGDRRAEVLATKTTRKPAKSRPDAATTTTTAAPAEGSPVKAASGASNASAESLEDLNRRRRAAQQQQRRPASTPTAQESASRPTSRPAQQVARSEEIADDIREDIVSTAATPVADPAQALRNVHFKRAGSSRTRDESTATTTTTTTAAPARSVEVRDTDPIEDDRDAFDDARPDTSHSDA